MTLTPKTPALLLMLALSGCVTDDRQARLRPYIGRTMAEFSQGTGMTPTSSYDTAQGRTFVVNGPTVMVGVSPNIAVAGGCRMQIETTQAGPRGTADAWQISAINAQGPC